MPRLAVLHTVAFLIDVFKPLLARAYPELDAYHVVDESLLQDLIRTGPPRRSTGGSPPMPCWRGMPVQI